jgi:heme/copper-type cytochrome/quinol oxidase subunit 1
MPKASLLFFSADSFLIGVPTGIKIFAWLGTMWKGRLRLLTPMLFAIGFPVLFVIGGLDGIHLAMVPVDWQVTDSYYVVSHLHYVLFGGAIFGLFAGIYYWFPKMTGRRLREGWGKAHFWLFFVGMNLVFMPMHILGLQGMPRRIYTYASGNGWDLWNLVETVGAGIIAIGVIVFMINFIVSMLRAPTNEADPWDGFTLEWTTSSPPPPYNFEHIPTVHGVRPLWDSKHPELADEIGSV